jgi:hypothetical protein
MYNVACATTLVVLLWHEMCHAEDGSAAAGSAAIGAALLPLLLLQRQCSRAGCRTVAVVADGAIVAVLIGVVQCSPALQYIKKRFGLVQQPVLPPQLVQQQLVLPLSVLP